MSGIAVFVPNEEMNGRIQEILKRKNYPHVKLIKTVETESAVYEARRAVSEDGINIIVARGKQAADIRKYTNVAVAEIVATAQELGLLVSKAKALLGGETPKIAVFYWGTMITDTTYFDTLYGIRLLKYQLADEETWRSVFTKACEEEPGIIIGGSAVREAAERRGIPAMPFLTTEESISLALDNAESLYRMAEIEQRNYAQFTTILDSSFNGIMKINNNGDVLVMNRAMEQITGFSEKDVMGMSVEKLFKEIDGQMLSGVLTGDRENYTTFINNGSQTLVMVIEPIIVEGRPEGAILSCNRLKRLEIDGKSGLKEQYLRGYVAHSTFESIEEMLPGLKESLNKAKLYAQSSSPILIEGYAGEEQDSICQGIHNYSLRKNGPFIVINLAGMSEDQQMLTLFGTEGTRTKERKNGAIEEADKGTLVIQSIDKMTLPVQYHFSKMLRSKRILYNSIEKMKIVDTRIIACTSKDISVSRKMNRMRSDLYYSLNALVIRIPPLRERPKDLEYLLDLYLKKYLNQYYRYHVLTAGARKALMGYSWPGNNIQLRFFCERMVLTADRRTITEEYVRSLMDELYVHTEEPDFYVQHDVKPLESEKIQKQSSEEAERVPGQPGEDIMREAILEKLKECHGNRTLTAKAMGISTTTLWRKMKNLHMI